MTGSPDLDRLSAWLDDEMTSRAPGRLLQGTLAGIDETARRPGWRIPERWIPMRIAFALAVIPRTALLLITMLVLTMLVAASLVLAAQRVDTSIPQTAPPRNGLVAYDSDGDIWVAAADGSGQRRLVDADNDLSSPTWSNDGTRLAYYEHTDVGKLVHVVQADGTGDTELTGGMGLDPLEFGNGGLAWSPDDESIALSLLESGRRAGGFLDWAPDDSAVRAQSTAWDALLIAGLDGSETGIPMRSVGNPSWQPLR
jgi:hypothetical protein